tara:strand:+ start:4662 stop:6500 length:1839 start_codon:yes stop_codon:yes gene_type:complete
MIYNDPPDPSDPNLTQGSIDISYGLYTFDIAPFLSRTQEMLYSGHSQQGQLTSIQLQGTLMVDDGTNSKGFEGLHNKRRKLLIAFQTDFETLLVKENGATILTFDNCIVESVTFDPSGNGLTSNYTINLKCYKQDYFANNYGILNPSDKTSYTYNPDGTITIQHSTSCQGIFTGGTNKPIQNAINWVSAYDNFALAIDPTPHFATGENFPMYTGALNSITQADCILRKESKNFNRLDGSYSSDKEYLLQTGDLWNAPRLSGVVSEVSTDIKSGINDEFMTVNVSYKLIGSKTGTASALREQAKQISATGTLFNIATGIDLGFANLVGHNNLKNFPYIPETVSIEDNAESSKEITISCDFITSLDIISGDGYYFDPTITIDTDEINSETVVSMNGTIKGIGPRAYRNTVISGVHENFAQTKGEYYKICNDVYTGIFGSSAWLLNPFPVSYSVKENKYKGTLDVSYSFNNKDVPVTGGFPTALSSNFTMNVTPSLQQYSAKASANTLGLYRVYDLKVKTLETVDISTSINHPFTIDDLNNAGEAFLGVGGHEAVQDHFVNGYARGPVSTRGVTVSESIVHDETMDTQTSPFNTSNMNTKTRNKLVNKQGTPFNL